MSGIYLYILDPCDSWKLCLFVGVWCLGLFVSPVSCWCAHGPGVCFGPCHVLLHCAILYSICFARLDMILGPPGPSTPRQKKYSSKGTKESPQFSTRLGRPRLHLPGLRYIELYLDSLSLWMCWDKYRQLVLFQTTWLVERQGSGSVTTNWLAPEFFSFMWE